VKGLRRLPRVRSALRRLYPGKLNAGTRFTIRRTAEAAAGRGESAAAVLATVLEMHRQRVSPWVVGELRRSLLIDLPDTTEPVHERPVAAASVLRGMPCTCEDDGAPPRRRCSGTWIRCNARLLAMRRWQWDVENRMGLPHPDGVLDPYAEGSATR
jgi:hypothetical protein